MHWSIFSYSVGKLSIRMIHVHIVIYLTIHKQPMQDLLRMIKAALTLLFLTWKYMRIIAIVCGNRMTAECMLLNFVIVILTISLFGADGACFCEQKTEVKLKSFLATMTDRFWRFMQNTRQPWNQDLMGFLCTGVVITKWHLCCWCCAEKALMFES